jgi:polyisoprenyl-phosphate glycosyltransferase
MTQIAAQTAAIKNLEGPIFIFGAGGFIGVNLFNALFAHRKDVYAITQDPRNNWRFIANNIPADNIVSCDINDIIILKDTLAAYKPRTIFNLAAYGAYSKQKEYKKIYNTNFNSAINIIEMLKEDGFAAYIHAGSSSEYGMNSAGPLEDATLVPNSHYAVSKAASFFAVKYYGQVEKLPVAHLRLYSAYGPWEEPDRLIPVIVAAARKGAFPPLVDPNISRDFVYVDDVCTAFIAAAASINDIRGEAFNVGTGTKTTIGDLSEIILQKYTIAQPPAFGNMPNRNWDVQDWYSNSDKAKDVLGWSADVQLEDGLDAVDRWQKEVNFDTAFWNWNK